MSWDIYGNPLRAGYCEVHPDVAQPWPCDICQSEYVPQPESEACQGCHYITGRMQECDGTCNGLTAETAEQMVAEWRRR